MATPKNQTAPAQNTKPTHPHTAPAAKPSNGSDKPASTAPATTDTAAPAKLSKRVTFWSQVNPAFNVRVLRTMADEFPAPDHGGMPMVRRSGRPAGGIGAIGKQAREEREKLLAAMTEEQKVAFLTKEREEKKARKTARKEAERAALKEQLRKELEAELRK